MNSVNMIGRMTADPELIYTAEGLARVKFSIAIDRPISQDKKKELESEGKQTADFPQVTVWGKRAEIVAKHFKKGNKIGISGSVRTGSYEKDDGKKVYTTDIRANQINFISPVSKNNVSEADVINDEIENVPF